MLCRYPDPSQSSHLLRPHSLRQGLVALPGNTRNLSLWSSKPAPAPSTPSTPEVLPEEVATLSPASDAVEPASATISEASSAVPPDAGVASDASNSLVDVLSSVSPDTLNAVSQYSDPAIAGLTSWSPAGLSVWGLDALHVATGMPWFWTIVAGTFAARLILIPFAAASMSNAAKLAEHQPEIQAVTEQVKAAYAERNQFEMQRAALAQRALFAKIGVNPLKNFIPLFVQLPVTIGMFLGVKEMCDLPLEGLKNSGFSLLTDLTVPDPTWILPILGTIVMNIQMTFSAQDMSTSEFAPHMINIFRVLTLAGTVWMGYLPAGTQLTVLCGTLALGVQTLVFRVPIFRRLFGIPLRPKNVGNKSVSMSETVQYIKDYFKKQAEEAQKQAGTKQTIQTINRPTTRRQRRQG
ncbi:60Kd inner membrane protein-domain-containing protein [Irpex lacteus]|nr:60Kd inner membrane protein-domain-containing protein [Irpex lacteus]